MKIPHETMWNNTSPAWLSVVNPKGQPVKPLIRCKCGEVCGIINHHVHPDGTVTGSFLHDGPSVRNPCGFHEDLELEHYAEIDGRDIPPGMDGPEHRGITLQL